MSKEELDKLFAKHMRLAKATLYKVIPNPKLTAKRKGLDLEDMYQYAYTGLWLACISYDTSKGTSFRTHVINNVRWHLLEKVKREGNPLKLEANRDYEVKKLPKMYSMDKTLSTDRLNNPISDTTLHDIYPSSVVVVDEVIDEVFVEELIGCAVTKEELDIINLRMQEKSYAEIGKILFNGCTGENVRYKIRRVKDKMKRHIKEAAV